MKQKSVSAGVYDSFRLGDVDPRLMAPFQMYEDGMRGAHAHLIMRIRSNVTHTSKLVFEHDPNGGMYTTVSFLLSNKLRPI